MSQSPSNAPLSETPSRELLVGHTSHSLLVRLRCRDAEAWRQCVTIYAPLVAKWCRRHGLSGSDTDDIAQNVFLAVSQRIDHFRKQFPEDSFRGWLSRITHRRIAEWWREKAQQDQYAARLNDLNSLAVRVEDPADLEEETRYLYRTATGLIQGEFSNRDWWIFWRLAVDGHTATDVGSEFGVTPAAARQIKSRVIRRVKQVLGDLEDEPPNSSPEDKTNPKRHS